MSRPTAEMLKQRLRDLLGSPTEKPPTTARSLRLTSCHRVFKVGVDNGLVADIINGMNLWHLDRVHQLPFITPEEVGPHPMELPHWMSHSRLEHSLAHAALMAELGLRLDLDEPLVKLGIALGLLHDSAIRPGGDSTKNLFGLYGVRDRVDEDDQFTRRMERYRDAWEVIVNTHRFPHESVELLARSIHGKTVLGQLHELADTLSYLDLDGAALQTRWNQVSLAHLSPGTKAALHILHQPFGARVLQSVRLTQTTTGPMVVVDDVEALLKLLRARVLLWQEVYTSSHHKYLEALYLELIGRELYELGRLSPDEMQDQGDDWLFREVQQAFGRANLLTELHAISAHGPEVRHYSSREALLEDEARAFRKGAFTVIAHQQAQARVRSKADRYFVRYKRGVTTVSVACRKQIAELEELIATKSRRAPWTLYVTEPQFSLTSALEAAWQRARLRWHLV